MPAHLLSSHVLLVNRVKSNADVANKANLLVMNPVIDVHQDVKCAYSYRICGVWCPMCVSSNIPNTYGRYCPVAHSHPNAKSLVSTLSLCLMVVVLQLLLVTLPHQYHSGILESLKNPI